MVLVFQGRHVLSGFHNVTTWFCRIKQSAAEICFQEFKVFTSDFHLN